MTLSGFESVKMHGTRLNIVHLITAFHDSALAPPGTQKLIDPEVDQRISVQLFPSVRSWQSGSAPELCGGLYWVSLILYTQRAYSNCSPTPNVLLFC